MDGTILPSYPFTGKDIFPSHSLIILCFLKYVKYKMKKLLPYVIEPDKGFF